MRRNDHVKNRKGRKPSHQSNRFTAFRLDRITSQKFPYAVLFAYVKQMPGGIMLLKELNYEQSIEDWATKQRYYTSYLDESLGVFTTLKHFIKSSRIACHDCGDIAGFRLAYQAEKLLAKFPRKGGNAVNQRTNAIRRFYEAEDMCKVTNLRFKQAGHDFRTCATYSTLKLIKGYVASILGSLDILSLVKGNRAGPGLTYDLGNRKMGETTPFFKYHDRLTATANARYYTAGMISLDYHWMTTTLTREGFSGRHLVATADDEAEALRNAIVTVKGNRITFVPKDADTDRTIAIEPSGDRKSVV